jgi:hypothetical protein
LSDHNKICTPEIFIEVPNIKLQVNSDIGSRAGTCGRTDGHNEDHRRFSRLYEYAYKGVAISIRTYEAGLFPITAWVSNLSMA